MLCDAQVQNERRRITLSSIVRIFNNTTFPLVMLNVDTTNPEQHNRVARIDSNKDYHVPIDLLYMHSTLTIFIGIDE